MSGNGYGAPYQSVPDNDSAYPLYPPTRPYPIPVQPRPAGTNSTATPSVTLYNQTQIPIMTPRYDDTAVIGEGGASHTLASTPLPNANATIYTDPYNPNKSDLAHDFTPAAQHAHGQHDDLNRWSFNSAYERPPGLRRFSGAWFKWHWNLQVSRRRLPRLMYILTGLLLMVGWLSITMSFINTLKHHEAKNSAASAINANAPPAPGHENQTFVFMSGQLNRFDPSLRTLNIDWTMFGAKGPLGDGNLRAREIPIDQWGRQVFALFRDTVARPDRGTNITDYQPFRVINPNIKPAGFLGVTEYDTINTDIGLGQESTSPWKIPEFGYPFDVFQGTITWVVASNATITRTGRPGSGVFGMRGAILTDSLLNLRVRSNVTATCFIRKYGGCELIIQLQVERTGLVKFCVLAVFLVNWIVTIAIFLVTGEALLLNRTNILSGTDILAICFSALFALPSVRSLLPGVPGYGCLLDMLGILPNVIIVALCTTFFANSRLRMRVHQQREREVKAE
ncbi:SubName: Full=Uncharacterized protein {ECO:0000313/EMBL:CCA74578.1} [Serendipita indica DSM 11827]|uniref:Uncharacterized protein n=1 Tax=Serendipita indica (strain DSM 11827) TaxID=1109443 RepID=G4TTD5_SERID|nr:SubName: Full=Uncharacterized protein {ECO:0000313/EMBL:CCA74578.1} [Serendipita indica DSM 11827]CCA74578.1 hypothetical protein PIIN_08530 [Serendipita indica DSM 11827]